MFEARIISGVKKVHHCRVLIDFSIPDEPGSGFVFDADDYGNPIIKCPECDRNFSLCIEKNYPCRVICEEWDSYTYPILKCICGAEIHCSGEGYYGA